MVHLRLNERESNPNPHINFIAPLPGVDPPATEDARQLLRALAAQVRPVMKSHGFEVNSFEEYEHNQVFAGRNWNNGETIEIVLRGAHGFFVPTAWLMSTLCHELAHIKHMNHGPAFQALWAQLRREVRDLQARGYYGDGYWSSGTRLADSARVGPQDVQEGDLPEYMCGGAHTRARPTRRRPRTSTPAAKRKRKPGTRVTSTHAFRGAGAGDAVGGAGVQKGAGFGKRAQSKRAREERAAAAEHRLRALQQAQAGPSAAPSDEEGADEEDEDEDGIVESVPETDQDRRAALLASMSASDADALRSGQQRFLDEFLLPARAAGPGSGASASGSGSRGGDSAQEEEEEEKKKEHGCDIVQLPRKGAAAATASSSPSPSKAQTKRRADDPAPPRKRHKAGADNDTGRDNATGRDNGKGKMRQGTLPVAYGALVQDEVPFRRKEALGLAGGTTAGRTLGEDTAWASTAPAAPARKSGQQQAGAGQSTLLGLVPAGEAPRERGQREGPADNRAAEASQGISGGDEDAEWSCLVCTLTNAPGHLACSACATPRGDTAWQGHHV